jgi:hypothetical protein
MCTAVVRLSLYLFAQFQSYKSEGTSAGRQFDLLVPCTSSAQRQEIIGERDKHTSLFDVDARDADMFQLETDLLMHFVSCFVASSIDNWIVTGTIW